MLRRLFLVGLLIILCSPEVLADTDDVARHDYSHIGKLRGPGIYLDVYVDDAELRRTLVETAESRIRMTNDMILGN